jgi:diguanylate cyclase (GGDEF)-like protein
MRRHRRSIVELSIILIALLVATYWVYEIDVFANEDRMTVKEKTIELDEALLLSGLATFGMLVFAVRRYLEQKREISRRVLAEERVRELAFQDVLTGLPNRRQFDDSLKAALAAPPRSGAAHAVFLLDLNGFKQVNDVHGHGIGDELLIVVAQRLLAAVRDGDLVARFGGDEFAVLARHVAGAEAATNVALRVIQALETPIGIGSVRHQVGVGVGIALAPFDGSTHEEVLRKADVALYRAKAQRRSALRFFEEQMDRGVRERESMERQLRGAMADGSLVTVYQPTVDLQTRRIIGFEAMPRWTHPTLGEVPAARFIPIAEETGLIHELAERILRDGCHTAARWPDQVALALDLYPVQLRDPEFKSRVLSVLSTAGLAPHRLEIEITESALVQELEAVQVMLGGLREAGVRIALDNFGTGYSSLYHLRNFKVDKIKIDRGFIESIISQEESAAIVSALVGLGAGLGLTVAAEGVDATQQRASLLASGCTVGQGHLFGAPVSAETTATFFEDRRVDQEWPGSLRARSGTRQ